MRARRLLSPYSRVVLFVVCVAVLTSLPSTESDRPMDSMSAAHIAAMAYRNKHAQEEEEEEPVDRESKGLSLDDLMGSDEEDDDDDEELVPLHPSPSTRLAATASPTTTTTTASPCQRRTRSSGVAGLSRPIRRAAAYFCDCASYRSSRPGEGALYRHFFRPHGPPLRQRSQSFMQVTTQHCHIQSSA